MAGRLDCLVHFSPRAITASEPYQAWMRSFPAEIAGGQVRPPCLSRRTHWPLLLSTHLGRSLPGTSGGDAHHGRARRLPAAVPVPQRDALRQHAAPGLPRPLRPASRPRPYPNPHGARGVSGRSRWCGGGAWSPGDEVLHRAHPPTPRRHRTTHRTNTPTRASNGSNNGSSSRGRDRRTGAGRRRSGGGGVLGPRGGERTDRSLPRAGKPEPYFAL